MELNVQSVKPVGKSQTIAEKDAEDLFHLLSAVGDESADDPAGLLLDSLCKLVGADAWAKSIRPKESANSKIAEVRYQAGVIEWNGLVEHLRDKLSKNFSVPTFRAIGGWREHPCGSFTLISLVRCPFRSDFSERESKLARIVLDEVPWIYHDPQPKRTIQKIPALSPSLQSTLQHLRAGCCRKEIADILGLSPNTVAEYTKEIYRRLGVSSKIELLRKFSPASPRSS